MRGLAVLLKVLAVVVLLPLSFCVALPRGINGLKAANWGWAYSRLPHPDHTDRIALRSGIDKLSNGDNCDFIVLEARAYAPEDEAAIRLFKFAPTSSKGMMPSTTLSRTASFKSRSSAFTLAPTTFYRVTSRSRTIPH